MENMKKQKDNSKLRGERLYMSLLKHDAGVQMSALTKYLNTFKPS